MYCLGLIYTNINKNKAIAKSNHPTEKIISSANECQVVGGGKRGEMLVRFSPSSAEKIKTGVLEHAEDTPKIVLNEKTGKMEAKPSAWRSEVGAIKELRSISAEDRCKFNAEDVVMNIRENGGGYLYVELFETPKTYNALDTDDVEETRKMFRSFVEGLKQIEGVRAYHSSLRTAKRSYVLYMTNVKDAIVRDKAVYFAAVGGAGAILSKCIKSSKVIAYDDLGTEAIREMYVEDFPVIVVIDSEGNNVYETEPKKYAKS